MPIKRVKKSGDCEGKDGYPTRDGAATHARRLNRGAGEDLPSVDNFGTKMGCWNPYRCKYCKLWHVGRQGRDKRRRA